MELSSQSQDILEKIHQRRYEVIEIQEDKTQLLICTISNYLFGMYGSVLKKIGPVKTITYVPGLPDYFLGLFNEQGDIYSMLNLHRLLKLEEQAMTPRSRFIIAQVSGISTGLLVDSVEDVLEVETRTIVPIPPGSDTISRYAVAEVEYKKQSVVLLDIAKLIRNIIQQNE